MMRKTAGDIHNVEAHPVLNEEPIASFILSGLLEYVSLSHHVIMHVHNNMILLFIRRTNSTHHYSLSQGSQKTLKSL